MKHSSPGLFLLGTFCLFCVVRQHHIVEMLLRPTVAEDGLVFGADITGVCHRSRLFVCFPETESHYVDLTV